MIQTMKLLIFAGYDGLKIMSAVLFYMNIKSIELS